MRRALLPGEFPPLLRAVRHHIAMVVATVLALVAGAGIYLVVLHDDAYTSEATVLLNPVPGNPLTPETAAASGTQLSVAMETEAGIVGTPQVAVLASEAAGATLPRPSDELSALVPVGTQMVRITYTSSSASAAQAGAQAFADAYLSYRGTNAEQTQEARLDALREQLVDWEQRLDDATQAAADGDPLGTQQVQIASARVAELNASIGSAQVVSTQPGSVTSPASLPEGADGLPSAVVMAAAAIAGLLLGCVLALFAEWRRDLVREDEQSEIAGLPVFASLPADTANALIVTEDRDTPAHESYRRLRAGVVANCPAPRALAVSAVGLSLDASAVTANLAVTLAQAGFKVSVVSAGASGDQLSQLLNAPAGPGLSEILANQISLEDGLIEACGVTVVRTGDFSGTRDLYGGPGLQDIVNSLLVSFDYVLVNAASTGTADGDAAISVASTVLLAVISSRTTHGQVTAALDRFESLEIQAVGLVNTPALSAARAVPTSASLRHARSGRPPSRAETDVITARRIARAGDVSFVRVDPDERNERPVESTLLPAEPQVRRDVHADAGSGVDPSTDAADDESADRSTQS